MAYFYVSDTMHLWVSVGLEVQPIYGSIKAELKEFYFHFIYIRVY